MHNWVWKAIGIVATCLIVMVVILGNLAMAALTEYGILPDIAWLAVGVLDLVMGGWLVFMWKY